MLTNFFEKTTKSFNVYCYKDKVLQNIENDTVSIIFKRTESESDEDAVISQNANVTNRGAEGIAEFTLSVADTTLDPRNYYYEIKWIIQTGEVYILESSQVNILDRRYD